MNAFVTAGAGFLLAVLWFDLMFDVQARRNENGQPLPEAALASIAAYYARVTTAARPDEPSDRRRDARHPRRDRD